MTPRAISIAVCALLIALAASQITQRENAVSSRYKGVDVQSINEMAATHSQTVFDPVTLNQSLQLALLNLGNDSKWQINRPHKTDHLNLYIIDSGSDRWQFDGNPELGVFEKNAVYIRHLSSIVLDFQLIEILAKKYYPDLDDQDWGRRGYFVDWIIAHEVGHHVNEHDSGEFWPKSAFNLGFGDRAKQARELAADKHLATSIVLNDLEPITPGYSYSDAYSSFLIRVLKTEGELASSKHDGQFKFVRWMYSLFGQSHPPYVIRAHHLLTELASESKNHELNAISRSLGQELGLTDK